MYLNQLFNKLIYCIFIYTFILLEHVYEGVLLNTIEQNVKRQAYSHHRPATKESTLQEVNFKNINTTPFDFAMYQRPQPLIPISTGALYVYLYIEQVMPVKVHSYITFTKLALLVLVSRWLIQIIA